MIINFLTASNCIALPMVFIMYIRYVMGNN